MGKRMDLEKVFKGNFRPSKPPPPGMDSEGFTIVGPLRSQNPAVEQPPRSGTEMTRYVPSTGDRALDKDARTEGAVAHITRQYEADRALVRAEMQDLRDLHAISAASVRALDDRLVSLQREQAEQASQAQRDQDRISARLRALEALAEGTAAMDEQMVKSMTTFQARARERFAGMEAAMLAMGIGAPLPAAASRTGQPMEEGEGEVDAGDHLKTPHE